MRNVIYVLLFILLTLGVLVLEPKLPKKVNISESNTVFSEKDNFSSKESDVNTQKENKSEILITEVTIKPENKEINILDTPHEEYMTTIKSRQRPEPEADDVNINLYENKKVSIKPNTQANLPYSEYDELLAWNKWHADIATESLRRINEAHLETSIAYGTWIIYSFNVDKSRKISNISIDSVIPPSEYEFVREHFIPILQTLNYDPILKFPEKTQRKQNKFIGTIVNDYYGRKVARPEDFNDYETIKNYAERF